MPAGSKLIATYIYDNSKRNPANPDPSKTVVWGDQSWEEMFYTAIRYRWVGETSSKMNDFDKDSRSGPHARHAGPEHRRQDPEGRTQGQMGDMLGKYFDTLDKNHDGALDG